MFSFFKNWLKKDETSLRSLDEIKNDLAEDAKPRQQSSELIRNTEMQLIDTELSLHPGWEERLDGEKKYTLRFLQAELPKMPVGTVGVTGFSLIPEEEGITVALFFRNATERTARFEKLTLSVYLDDRLFANHQCDLTNMGAVPPGTSRPWEVFFPTESFVDDNFSFSRWKVKMDLGNRTHVWPTELDLDPEMEKRMTETMKDKLMKLVNTLPSLAPDQVEMVGFDLGKKKDGSIVICALFRNATEHEYAPPALKVSITDAAGDLVVKGTMDTSKLRVQPRTSRPWILVFPESIIRKKNADLREWNLNLID
ncbi:SLAP domain-containing protein [Brevibacillus fluminis]|uniref:SLAP domain-containing protein n=1 Tax=Brevibacillus fluminis TaxID=511487 RepID=A0A3M8DYP1_9BACL|nr:SLAP domain-containing protein [Brevibacillus fluminis]RNB92665.1 SLAP domain-containing protein [Brevibacillus fluminis]